MMSASKRPSSALSDVEDAPLQKTSKVADSVGADLANQFEVKIEVPSASKAAKNDYKEPTAAQLKLRSRLRGDRTSPLTEEERQEIFGGLWEDLAERSTRAVTPQMEDAAEVERRGIDDSPSFDQQADSTTAAKIDLSSDEGGTESDHMSDGDSLDGNDHVVDGDHLDNYDSEDIWDGEELDDYATDSNFDEYEDFAWFEAIKGSVYLRQADDAAKQDPVGSCGSALVRRHMIRQAFYHEIEEPTEESSAMGFALFDRYGRLKPAFKKNASKAGSGIWGDELDIGYIHLIDSVRVEPSHRRKGLGKMLLQNVLEKGIAKSNPRTYNAIARDAVYFSEVRHECEGKTEEEKSAIYDRQRHIAQLFLRSLGFRRIGWTEWFAWTGDKGHQCHRLPADQDFDPTSTSPPVPNSIMDALIRDLKTLETDEARLSAAQNALGDHMPDDSTWSSTDADGNTLLHLLADSESPECVKWVLPKCPKLADVRNSEGNTPLESFEDSLKVTRTQKRWMAVTKPMSDQFAGFSEAAVAILVAFKHLSELAPLDLLRLKYGCTCGQCQFGFLSPRMHFVLLTHAEMEHDMLSDDMFISDGDMFVNMNQSILEFLPVPVRDNLRRNRSMRQGFANLFLYFARCLKGNDIPTAEVVLDISRRAREWPPVTRNYFDRGGTMYAVGSALFEKAMQSSQWAGDGSTEDLFGEEIDSLSTCRNDDEYGFVSGMCGHRRVCRVRYVSLSGELLDDQI